MDRTELLRFARLGAEARLRQLQGEIEAIVQRFPDLGTGRRARVPGVIENGRTIKGTRRRRMSAAARKAISLRQKQRWAEWRKKKAKSAAS
jgi:hypothetical protein